MESEQSSLAMQNRLKLIVDALGADKFKFDEPLKDVTYLKVGGPAKLFFVVFTENEIIRIIDFCRQLKIPFIIFGTGSKMMISDKGFDGVVIKNRTRNIKVLSIKGKVSKIGIGVEEVLIEVESGVNIDHFIDFLKKQGLFYEEFLNVSGSIGGNLFLNQTLQQRADNIKVLDNDGKINKIMAHELNIRRHIVLSTIFRIKAI